METVSFLTGFLRRAAAALLLPAVAGRFTLAWVVPAVAFWTVGFLRLAAVVPVVLVVAVLLAVVAEAAAAEDSSLALDVMPAFC